MIKSWSQVICFMINILTQIHAIIYVIKYFDIQINLPLWCRINKAEEGKKSAGQSKIYGRCVDDRSLQRENKNRKILRRRTEGKSKRQSEKKSIGKEISWYTKIYWLQVAHTGDYLLNDCEKVQSALRYRNVKLSMAIAVKTLSTFNIPSKASETHLFKPVILPWLNYKIHIIYFHFALYAFGDKWTYRFHKYFFTREPRLATCSMMARRDFFSGESRWLIESINFKHRCLRVECNEIRAAALHLRPVVNIWPQPER